MKFFSYLSIKKNRRALRLKVSRIRFVREVRDLRSLGGASPATPSTLLLGNHISNFFVHAVINYFKYLLKFLLPIETPALDEILKAHMVEGFVDTADVHDEDILQSVNGLNIRMTVYNTYPQRAVMANCAKITSRDHFSTNGVVHIVDKVILPATKTLKEMVETDVQFARYGFK